MRNGVAGDRGHLPFRLAHAVQHPRTSRSGPRNPLRPLRRRYPSFLQEDHGWFPT